VLLSAGALLGLPAAGLTVAPAPASAGVVTVASGPATASGGFNGDGRTGLTPLGAWMTQYQCCPSRSSRTRRCIIC